MRTFTRVEAVAAVVVACSAVFAAPAAAQEETLYLTKFADPAETAVDWGFPSDSTEVSEDGFTASIEPGALVLTLDGARNAWLGPDFGSHGIDGLPADQAIEAREDSVRGDDSALFGVRCRTSATGKTNGYGFVIATDGYYAIARYKNGKATVLVNKRGTKHTDAVEPLGPNTVRGACVGKKKTTLTLSVNGEKVASVVDASPPRIGDQADVYVEVADGAQATTEFTGFAAHSL
jgi:hypothetical protein